jgi:CO/xanthine dehydrogenase Mo-binding subunit
LDTVEVRKAFTVVGTAVPRVDAVEKTTGAAQYVADISRPGMLHAAVLRSPYARARILGIDVSKAAALEGVRVVMTAGDTPKIAWGQYRRDQYPLALGEVHFAGDEVAAVAAVDLRTAREALKLIEVEWQELEPVLSLDEACAGDAPLVHDDAPGNVVRHLKIDDRGDVDAGFAKSDLIVEETFESVRQWHASLEPIGSVAEWDADGRVTIWSNIQAAFTVRERWSIPLGIAERDIRVVQTEVGGGFGGKGGDDNNAVVCALLAKKAGRPVKLVNSREDEFLSTRTRLPMRIDVKIGFSRDGRVQAKQLRVMADAGAYCGRAAIVMGVASTRHDAVYKYPAVRSDSTLYYTNLIPAGAFRGYGNPSAAWAVEQAWDIAGRRLGIDTPEMLRRNVVQPGDVSPHDHRISSCELHQCIDKATALIRWDEKRRNRVPNRGLGMACSVHVNGRRSYGDWDGAVAIVMLGVDGRATIISGEGEAGQGGRTTLCQIAAEVLGLPMRDVAITRSDTALTPHALGTFSSRITYTVGGAIANAARIARTQLLDAAASQLGVDAEQLTVEEGWIVRRDDPSGLHRVPVGEIVRRNLFRRNGQPIAAIGTFDSRSVRSDEDRYGNESGAYNFVAEAVEVEVDPQTGMVKVLELAAVADCGTVINPLGAEGQVRGAIAQGLGYALSEWFAWSDGRPQNPNFGDYKLPTMRDMPKIHVAFADSYEESGPFGAKGVAEIALDVVPAIVANAIYDAVGVRIRTLPITPEKVYRALHPELVH